MARIFVGLLAAAALAAHCSLIVRGQLDESEPQQDSAAPVEDGQVGRPDNGPLDGPTPETDTEQPHGLVIEGEPLGGGEGGPFSIGEWLRFEGFDADPADIQYARLGRPLEEGTYCYGFDVDGAFVCPVPSRTQEGEVDVELVGPDDQVVAEGQVQIRRQLVVGGQGKPELRFYQAHDLGLALADGTSQVEFTTSVLSRTQKVSPSGRYLVVAVGSGTNPDLILLDLVIHRFVSLDKALNLDAEVVKEVGLPVTFEPHVIFAPDGRPAFRPEQRLWVVHRSGTTHEIVAFELPHYPQTLETGGAAWLPDRALDQFNLVTPVLAHGRSWIAAARRSVSPEIAVHDPENNQSFSVKIGSSTILALAAVRLGDSLDQGVAVLSRETASRDSQYHLSVLRLADNGKPEFVGDALFPQGPGPLAPIPCPGTNLLGFIYAQSSPNPLPWATVSADGTVEVEAGDDRLQNPAEQAALVVPGAYGDRVLMGVVQSQGQASEGSPLLFNIVEVDGIGHIDRDVAELAAYVHHPTMRWTFMLEHANGSGSLQRWEYDLNKTNWEKSGIDTPVPSVAATNAFVLIQP